VTTHDDEPAAVRAAVDAVRKGNADAFSEIVRRYQRRVFGLALMLLREPAAAEEVTQDAFVRAYTHLDAYDTGRPFYPWLATIAVRLSQNRIAHRGRIAEHEAPAPGPEIKDAGSVDPLLSLIASEEGRQLWQSVAALPAGERSAVILHYHQDLGVKDVARALGVTAGTVKTFLFRARQRLRRIAADASDKDEDKETP